MDHLEILHKHLDKGGYDIFEAHDGVEALEILHAHPEIDAVVLDRMMPELDGMEVFHQMQRHDKLKRIPVVFQTAMSEQEHICEGIAAGAHYYLTKPYNRELLVSVVESAVTQGETMHKMQVETAEAVDTINNFKDGLTRMDESRFHYRSLKGAKAIAPVLAACFKHPRRVVMGLVELMINSVEHGNLGIDYSQKAAWLMDGTYTGQIALFQEQANAKEMQIHVELRKFKDQIQVTITDQGVGFDYEPFMRLDEQRATSPNGRGIYIASKMLDKLYYLDGGRKVVAIAEAG